MKLKKFKLKELIEYSSETNINEQYGINDVQGVSIQKQLIRTKANMQNVSLKPYLIVKPNYFVYVPTTSRNGEKITLAHNKTDKTYIVSSSYIVFYVKNSNLLNSNYLFMYFNRPEFDRYSRFNSWGSARETFDWEEICDIDIKLPDIEIQNSISDIYNDILNKQKYYEKELKTLKFVCDAYIEHLKKEYKNEAIGKYIEEQNNKNSDNKFHNVYGVSKENEFIKAKTKGENISNYKIVEKFDFVYNPARINIGSIALSYAECVVSPMYVVFRTKNSNKLLSEYLYLWLLRREFFRSTSFYATGSVRDTFNYNSMGEVKIPIPPIEIQQNIVDVYDAYRKIKFNLDKLKNMSNNLCSVLIRGSIS